MLQASLMAEAAGGKGLLPPASPPLAADLSICSAICRWSPAVPIMAAISSTRLSSPSSISKSDSTRPSSPASFLTLRWCSAWAATCGRCVTHSTCVTQPPSWLHIRCSSRPTCCPRRAPTPLSISSSTRMGVRALLLPHAGSGSEGMGGGASPLPPTTGTGGKAAVAAVCAALRASIKRATSPPEATAPSGRSGSCGPAANRYSTLSRPPSHTRKAFPAASPTATA
mmetsp:Transcript_34026/g.96395  ORF Transcript_34026/g.96395 Transcript_34026/m.96395 type:complete len:226 (-) Transcript_34026:1831-2508(-)